MYVAKFEPGACQGATAQGARCENEDIRDDAKIQCISRRIGRIPNTNRCPKWTIGYVFCRRGHVYEVVGFVPYTTRAGLDIQLIELAGWCAVCSGLFFSTASKKRCRAGRYGKGLLRTCEAHRGEFHGNKERAAAKPANSKKSQPKPEVRKPVARPNPAISNLPAFVPSPEARAHIELVHTLAAGADGALLWRSDGQVPRSRCRLLSRHGLSEAGDVAGTLVGMSRHVSERHRNVGMAMSTMQRAPFPWAERRRCVAAVLALATEVGDLAAPPFRPSYVLEVAPGRHTAFYILERPATPDAARPVAEALARFTGCIASADLAHPWPIPGLIRWPSRAEALAGRPTDGFAIRIARPYTGERVNLAELAAWLEVLS